MSALTLFGMGAADALAATKTTDFSSPGEYSFKVPAGVHDVTIVAVGAAGGACNNNSAGGLGAALTARAPVTPGERLFIGVGGPGASCNDGGAGGSGGGAAGGASDSKIIGPGAGGGGASAVATLSPFPGFSAALVVAGGGGGAAGFPGGDAGSPGHAAASGEAGGAGTATRGGSGGTDSVGQHFGHNGVSGLGGRGAPWENCTDGGGPGGGGGGGGYFGGGGGANCDRHEGAAGGGGGSSFVAPRATTLLAPAPAMAPPAVSLTYAAPRVHESDHTIDFGDQTPGTVSQTKELTVSNEGTVPLVVSSRISLSGAHADDFLVADHCQEPVPPGANCHIGVRFAPLQTGVRSAMLQLMTNATNDADAVKLTGGEDHPTALARTRSASADANKEHEGR